MVLIKTGTIIKNETLKSGVSEAKGKWLYGFVNAETGYDRIQVWASNADKLDKDYDLTVAEINQVQLKNEKYTAKDGTEKWVQKTIVQARLEPVKSDIIEEFAQLRDDSIPF